MHRLQELVRLHRMGTRPREVARLLGMSPNTERQYRDALSQAGVLDGDARALPPLSELRELVEKKWPVRELPQRTSSVERWRPVVEEMVDRGAEAKAIFDYLRLNVAEFAGSESAVKRLVRRVKQDKGVSANDVVIPVETAPGEVAQVDFGYVGKLFDPAKGYARKAYVFVMVLAYSRRMVVRLVFDQKLKTWLRLHAEAFDELGGVPHVVVPDNLKAAVIRAAFGVDDETELNKSFRELARHYGFKVDPTPPRSPEKKGKVEGAVKYVKSNFFSTCLDEGADAIRPQLQRWVDEVANVRVHGTTRRRPNEVFDVEEKQALLGLPGKRFEIVEWKRARVHRDTHVQVDRAFYSVPWRLVGELVDVRATPSTIALFFNDERVATHDRALPGRRRTNEAHLPHERRHLRHRSRGYWEERAAAIGPDVATWVQQVFDSDDVLLKLRVVQSSVVHLEQHPKERANNACRRASFFGNLTYGGVKDILKKALDFEPLPVVIHDDDHRNGNTHKPRFARHIAELYQLPLEIEQ